MISAAPMRPGSCFCSTSGHSSNTRSIRSAEVTPPPYERGTPEGVPYVSAGYLSVDFLNNGVTSRLPFSRYGTPFSVEVEALPVALPAIFIPFKSLSDL